MDPETEKKLWVQLAKLEKQVTELLVVIDTAQAALRRADAVLSDEDKKHVINPSAKWVMDFKL